MSQSFEDKLGDKLSWFEPKPNPDAKEQLFALLDDDAPSGGWWPWFAFGGLLVFLLLVPLYLDRVIVGDAATREYTFFNQQYVDEHTELAASDDNYSVSTGDQVHNRGTLAVMHTLAVDDDSELSALERGQRLLGHRNLSLAKGLKDSSDSSSSLEDLSGGNSNRSPVVPIYVRGDNSESSARVAQSSEADSELNRTSSLSKDLMDSYHRWSASQSKREDLYVSSVDRKELGLDWNPDELVLNYYGSGMNEVEESKRKKKFEFLPYFDLGTFFLYNRVQPNMNDELVVSNFESESGLSLKRLGFFVESGVHKRISDYIDLNLGASVAMYNQSFDFDIREREPSEVIRELDGNTVNVTPVFNEQRIGLDHQVWMAGLKFGSSFYVLPSETSSLYVALEYGKVLNPNQSFDYDGDARRVSYQDQLLINLGLRKTMVELKKGRLTVVPNIRYSLLQAGSQDQTLSVKPFSAGISLSYLID